MTVPFGHKGTLSELKGCVWLLEQGYDVFRNISPSGKVDIIAIKFGNPYEMMLIDVKSALKKSDGYYMCAELTDEQKKRGVKRLVVTKDWIDWDDRLPKPPPRTFHVNSCGHPDDRHFSNGMCKRCWSKKRYADGKYPKRGRCPVPSAFKERLNAKKAEEMRANYAAGMTLRQLAQCYSVTENHARSVVRGKIRYDA